MLALMGGAGVPWVGSGAVAVSLCPHCLSGLYGKFAFSFLEVGGGGRESILLPGKYFKGQWLLSLEYRQSYMDEIICSE